MDTDAGAERIAALDILRGVAVLGILAVNIAGFAGPRLATETPAWNGPASWWDAAAFAFVFLVFEGKMRALFSLLFGASMLLFARAVERRGQDGDLMQLRRLGWLLLFGYGHYLLLWWGDILFDYAVAGFLALMLRRLPVRGLLVVAAVVFLGWHGWGIVAGWPGLLAGEHVRQGMASAAEMAGHDARAAADLARMKADVANAGMGFGAAAADRWAREPGWPLTVTFYTLGETLPLMLLGMALLRGGFFGGWARARLRVLAWGGIGLGGAMTVAMLALVWPRHFPAGAMSPVLAYWMALPHVLMALGYAAALLLAMGRLAASRPGARLAAAGRMAFTNYLATTVAMTFVFCGWGLGWFGRVGAAAQLLVVVAWWLVLLGWSEPWLARFRQGPLEWAWRSLTEWRIMPLIR